MKKIVLIVVMLIAVPALKAQKKEIKKAQRDISAGNYASAASHLSQAKRIFAAADQKTRSEYYVVQAELTLAQKELDVEQIEFISHSIKLANSFEVTPALQDRITQINLKINQFSAKVAAGEFAKKNYSDAASLFNTAYQSSRDTLHLLKAARSHLLAKEYEDAYKTYNHLFLMGYTNAKTHYVATNVTTNNKQRFPSIELRDEAITAGLFKHPENLTSNSKLPEILRGITVAAIALDKKYAAVAIIDRALAKTPGDKMLLNQVSHLYEQLDAHDKYNAIVDRLLKDSPNDPNLYYNSAVTSAENNDIERAKSLYKKALEIDPKFTNAKINLSTLLLEKDKVINDEMNALGVSEADDARYKELKLERNKLYNEVLPYLESIVKSQPQNGDFAKKLMNIYNFIGANSNIAILEEEE